MENVDIDSYKFCLLAAIITTRLLILKNLYENETLIAIFNFIYKAIVFVYYSIYIPFLLSKKIIIKPTLH